MNCGLNLMECDVHLSRDGEVVVSHDSDLERMCGPAFKNKKIGDFDFNELPKFQQQIQHHLAEGHYTVRDSDKTQFTLLRELFEHSEGVFVSIDMKDSNDELCRKVDSLVREFKREDLTFWGSMFDRQHKMVQKLNPRVSCFFSGK